MLDPHTDLTANQMDAVRWLSGRRGRSISYDVPALAKRLALSAFDLECLVLYLRQHGYVTGGDDADGTRVGQMAVRGSITELVALIDAPETPEERADSDNARRWWWWVPLFLVVLTVAVVGAYVSLAETINGLLGR